MSNLDFNKLPFAFLECVAADGTTLRAGVCKEQFAGSKQDKMVLTIAVIMQVKHIVFIPRLEKISIPLINADKMPIF